MEPQRFEQLKSLFTRALKMHPDERRPFLIQMARRDATLRNEVQALLDAHAAPLDLDPLGRPEKSPTQSQGNHGVWRGDVTEHLKDSSLRRLRAGTLPAVDACLVRHHVADCRVCQSRSTRLGERPEPMSGPGRRKHALLVRPSVRYPLQPLQSVGPYRILEKIAEGGMGVVYLAEQSEPIRRRVALKVIKLGMDTRAVIARFEAERQALAMMDHPNVAKVLDAGVTDHGRSYFVMEYVQGETITDYCDRHRLTLEDRLLLFVDVCHAVQHAHHKAIIHRDIKPSNILVAICDGKATPKVIDFGVAKATTQQLTDKTLFTNHGQLIGTPEYMSPEQAEMSPLNVDTRTDVYSLGVVVYELLSGVLPYDWKAIRNGTPREHMGHTIRDREPPRPSMRVGAMPDRDASAIAIGRRTDPWRARSAVAKRSRLDRTHGHG